MRKAFKVQCERLSQPTVIRVKLTAYKPARPVTLERFRGVPASAAKAAFRAAPLALVREYEDQYNRAYTV